jgi:hypothetical protein
MEKEQIKEITTKAIQQLIAALNKRRSETLTKYVRAIGRFIDLFPTRSPMAQTSLAELLS